MLCMQTDPLTELKRQKTNMDRFGCKHAQQSQVVKNTVKQNRQKRIENDPNYLINIGNAIRNGFKEKEQENPNYWKEREQKSKQTKIANGHDPNWNNREKFKKTLNGFSDERKQEIYNKREKTIKPYKDQIIAKQIATKTKKRKEDPNYIKNILNKRYKTKQEKYGNPYFRNSKKAKQTCFNKYGVESFAQTYEYHVKRQKSFYSKEYEIEFDSKWEFLVYDFCKKHNFNVTYQPNIAFEYFFENKTHIYKPDFLINNQLYEVKGDHFFKDGKMICPFRNKAWSNEKYANMCALYEAKHQCMINNGIIILKYNELKRLEQILL